MATPSMMISVRLSVKQYERVVEVCKAQGIAVNAGVKAALDFWCGACQERELEKGAES